MFYQKNLKTEFRSCTSVTADVMHMITDSGVQDGLCLISIPAATAGLAITSFWDTRGLADMLDEIDRNVPTRVSYKYQESPYAASGHVKSALMGSSASLIIRNGKPLLGSSQGLVFVEFDGPRPREICVQIIEKPICRLDKKQLSTTYMGMHDLTEEIQKTVSQSGVKNGLCHISMLHSTAGLLLTSNNSVTQKDVMADIERMVPTRVDFKHRETASDAGGHVKTGLTGSQISLPVENGRLVLGNDQAVVFAEYDGPRPRSYYIAVYED